MRAILYNSDVNFSIDFSGLNLFKERLGNASSGYRYRNAISFHVDCHNNPNFNGRIILPPGLHGNYTFNWITDGFNKERALEEGSINYSGIFQDCFNYNQPIEFYQRGEAIETVYGPGPDYSYYNAYLISGTMFTNTFRNCYNLNSPIKINGLNVTYINQPSHMFANCYNFNSPITATSEMLLIWSMDNMFFDCQQFNQPIQWTVLGSYIPDNHHYGVSLSNVFCNCTNLNSSIDIQFNSPVVFNREFANNNPEPELNSNYNFSTERMFYNCVNFNSPVSFLNDTSSMILPYTGTLTLTMSNMFVNCYKFNQNVGINFNLNSTNNTKFYQMFRNCNEFNGLTMFDVSVNANYANSIFSCMFYNCKNLNPSCVINIDLTANYAANAFDYMFYNCYNLNTNIHINLNLPDSDSRSLAFTSMLDNCHYFNSELALNCNSGTLNLYGMFSDCWMFNQKFNIPNVSNHLFLEYAFKNCHKYNQVLDIPAVAGNLYLNRLFYGCDMLDVPIQIPDVHVFCAWMFYGCTYYNQDVYVPDNAVDFRGILQECNHYKGLVSIPHIYGNYDYKAEYGIGIEASAGTLGARVHDRNTGITRIVRAVPNTNNSYAWYNL